MAQPGPRRFSLSVSSVWSVVVAAFELIGLRLRLARSKLSTLISTCDFCSISSVMIVEFPEVVFTNWDVIWNRVRGVEAKQSRASVFMRMIRQGEPTGSAAEYAEKAHFVRIRATGVSMRCSIYKCCHSIHSRLLRWWFVRCFFIERASLRGLLEWRGRGFLF